MLSLIFAIVVLAIKPGPYMMAFISMAIDGRWKSMIVFWLGSVTAGTILYFGLLTGLTYLFSGFGLVFLFLKCAAAMIFVTMGFSGLQDLVDDDSVLGAERAEKLSAQSVFANLSSGFFLTLSNPYDIVFIITVIPTLLSTMHFTLLDIAYIRGILITIDVLILAIYCIPLLILRTQLSPILIRRLKVVSSLLMVGIGFFLFYTILFQFDLQQTNLISV